MKHRVAGRKLGRTSMHRIALLRNLSTELFRHERIRTTLMKAKELRPFAEKLITLSKRESLHARRLVLRDIHDKDVVSKMFDTISSRFAQRPGGYTRIVKLGPRRGDNAEMALIELIGAEAGTKAAAAPAGSTASEPAGKAGKTGKAAKSAKAGKAEPSEEKSKAAKAKAEKKAKPAKGGDESGTKKSARTKGAPKPRTESKGKSKSGAATRKVGKSGS
jgi:large subunit ribosomal protein L17